jgi:hypothetical protein
MYVTVIEMRVKCLAEAVRHLQYGTFSKIMVIAVMAEEWAIVIY